MVNSAVSEKIQNISVNIKRLKRQIDRESRRKDVYLGNDTKRGNLADANYVSGHAFARVSVFACMPVTSSSASLCTCVHVMV